MSRANLSRVINVGLRGLTLISKFLLVFLLARYLAPSELGLYGLLAATVSYSLFFVGLDFYAYTTRELLRQPRSQWGQLIKSHAALGGMLYVLFAPLFTAIFITGLLPVYFAPWFGALLVTEHLGQELNRLLVAASEQITASIILFLRLGVWGLAAAALMLVDVESRALDTVFTLWLAGGSTACLLGAWKLHQLQLGGWGQPVDWSWVRRGIGVALPLLIATLALRGLFTVDRYWVEAVAGLQVLGAYVLFMGMATALMSLLDAGVFVFLYPQLIAAFNDGDHSRFRTAMRSLSIHTLALAGGFAVVAMVVIKPLLIWIDRPEYLHHQHVFPWVLLAMVVHAASMIPHYGLYAQGADRPIIQGHIGGLITFALATWALTRVDAVLAVPMGLCIAFGMILAWKCWVFARLTSRDLRQAHAQDTLRFE